MLTMCKDLDESIVCCETEQAMNSRECSEIVFNNGYAITMIDTSNMMDNTLQIPIQPSINTLKHSMCYYFSTTFEVTICILSHCKVKATLSNKLLGTYVIMAVCT